MQLIAVPRREVERALTHANGVYDVFCIWAYNSLFTNTIDVLPIAEPDSVIADIGLRLQGLADIVSWEWHDDDLSGLALMRFRISEHASPSVS